MKKKLKCLSFIFIVGVCATLAVVKIPVLNKIIVSKELKLNEIFGRTIETEEGTLYCKLKLKITSSKTRKIHISDLGKHGYFYKFAINYNGQNIPALCAAAGKKAKSGMVYKITDAINNELLAKALKSAEDDFNNDMQRLAAQIAAWAIQQGQTGNILKYIEDAFADMGYTKQQASSAWTSIQNKTVSTPWVCVLKPNVSNDEDYQPVYTSLNGECSQIVNKLRETRSCKWEPNNGNKKCKKYQVEAQGSLPNCPDGVNTGKTASTTLSEVAGQTGWVTYSDWLALGTDSDGSGVKSAYGRELKEINDYCKLHCLEEVDVVLPGGYSKPFNIGSTNLVWPQSKKNHAYNNYSNYKLVFKGRQKCHVVFEYSGFCGYEDFTDEEKAKNDANHPYYKYRKYVNDNKNEKPKDKLATGSSKSSKTTAVPLKLEQIRSSSYCSNGNITSDNLTCYEAYFNAKFSKSGDMERWRDDAEAVAKADCLETGKTHSVACTTSTCSKDGCTCTYTNNVVTNVTGTYQVANDQTYCDANFTDYEEGDLYTHWETYISALSDAKEKTKKYIKNYYNAKKVLVNLYKCHTKSFSGALDNLEFNASVDMSYNDDEYGNTYNLDPNRDNMRYRCTDSSCTNSSTSFLPRDEINTIAELIDFSTMRTRIEEMEKRIINFETKEVEFSIPNTGYKYVDLENGELLSSLNDNKHYIKKNYNFMPISLNADVSKKYDLKLFNIDLGDSELSTLLQNQQYVCHYKVTTNGDDPCMCPAETGLTEISLEKYVIPGVRTCYEAQKDEDILKKAGCKGQNKCPEIYNATSDQDAAYSNCLANSGTHEKCVLKCYGWYECPDGTHRTEVTACVQNDYVENYTHCVNLYCPGTCVDCYCGPDTDYPEKIITGCLNKYKDMFSNETDLARYCRQSECFKYLCPPDSPKANMDIKNCVEFYLKNTYGVGKNTFKVASTTQINKAKSHCISDCYDNGLNIIYRTIKLENPFPSYDADESTSKMPSIGTFNLDVRGRYPGSNWDSKLLVYNQIINNRGTQYKNLQQLNSALGSNIQLTGSTIYQTETPLYTFRLTPTTINNIRSYNRQQNNNGSGGYADFTLNCKKATGSSNRNVACRSSFIRNLSYGIQTGTSTCYTTGVNASIASFNSCAER